MNKRNGDGEDLYNINKLNATFAISSIIVLITIIAMVWADYTREWKVWQRQFNDLEITRTEQAIAQADSAIDKAQLQQLDDSLTVVDAQLAQRKSDIEATQKQVNSLAALWYKMDQDARFAKATYDAEKYEYEKAALADSSRAQKRRENLDQLLAVLTDLNEQVKQITAQKDSAEAALAQLTVDRDRIQKQQEELNKTKARLEQKLASIGRLTLSTLMSKDLGRIFSAAVNDFFRNQPLVDFINPSLRVQQVVVDNIRENVNFSTIPKVDRCTTCHLAIDRPGYEEEAHPFKTHPNLAVFMESRASHPMPKFGCTSCHLGRGRGTTFVSVAHTPQTPQQAEEWEHTYDWESMHLWDDPMLPAEYTEAGCLRCHRGVVEVPQADHLNRGLELVEQLGCWGCHKIQGQGLEGLRKVGPDLTRSAAKVTKAWAFKWVRDPKGFRPTTRMPKFFNLTNTSTPEYRARNDVEVAAIVEYIFKNSGSMDFSPPPVTGDAGRGKLLVETVGCRGCHVVGEGDEAGPTEHRRLFGPNLSTMGSKVTAAWLYNWVKNPEAYFPETRMPNLRLSDQEAADVTAYLLTLQGKFPDETVPPVDTRVLDRIATEFLTQQMTTNQASARVASMPADEKQLFVGERLINRYGCFGCHVIKGFENAQPIGTELTEEGNKIIEQLDFGFSKLERTRQAWFFQKLKDPRIFDLGVVKRPDEKLKMPNFLFSDEDAKAIVTVLLGLRNDPIRMEIRKNLSRREADAEDGMKLIKRYNCQGCHLLNGKGRDIAPSLTKQMVAQGRNEVDALAFLPPILDGEGSKVQPDWLYQFLKAPTTIRPWFNVRMPTFGFSNEELTALVKGFSAMAAAPFPYVHAEMAPLTLDRQRVAQQLFSKDYFSCLSCHQQGAKKPEGPPEGWAPDLALAKQRLRPDWVITWLQDPQKVTPGTKMPSFYPGGPPDVLDGDEAKQIEVIRDYVINLGGK